MEKYTKLKSGKWNRRVFDFTDEDGKRHYKSFTASTKGEIRQMIAEWKVNGGKGRKTIVSVSDAFGKYIELKESVLSPSTLRGYNSLKKTYIDVKPIGKRDINDLGTEDVQKWVSELAAVKSPKTVRNAFGMLTAVCSIYAPNVRLNGVRLPQKVKPKTHCPSEVEVQAVLDTIRKHHDKQMELAVMLAAFGPMRRSEITALTPDDIDGTIVSVNKALVLDSNHEWVIKQPKSYGGYRDIEFPQNVIDMMDFSKDRIIDCSPDYLTERFEKYVALSPVQPFRFHDLRHFGASMQLTMMAARYAQDRGGWSSAQTMHSVYDNVIDYEKQKQTKIWIDYLDKFS